MKNTISIMTLVLITIGFNACSGEGGDASFANGETIIPITIACETTPTATDIDNYETLLSADAIVKDDDNTTVSIYHDIDGNKKICLVSGVAHIVR
ncbi:hypothetical protein [Candidatus Sulfurimonas baltica]|uniref:Uncharacterized protein n=1 Tax=Candidatus Sulfurimonas baltica TaxID=2740404 RepID=A0A7S7LSY6_9BACT|nr:hypothetical protein [Candidatus Sulfurimonas baltica]QOY50964.1 hypothetical protein HUE88_07350 [Candidatus Sulfurimonas baltica]